MSDTPETDAQGFGDGRHPWVATDFACKLERERDDLQKAVNNLCNHLGVNPANTTLLAVEILKIIRERDEAREAFVIATDQMVVAQGKVREANKERDEALIDRTNGDIATMTINHYERILRERDEVKEKYRWAVIHWQIGSAKMERERDESAAMCGRYKQERDIAEADATNFRAKIFELINERDILRLDAQREAEQHDRMVGELEKVYAERDEARELLASEKITRDHVIKRGIEMQKERDEAREALKHIEEYGTEEINAAVDLRQKLASALVEREEWKNKAYSHATDYTLMEAKCFRLEQQLKEYDKLKS